MHILVAHNLTPAADLALARAVQLAADTGSALTIVHVPPADGPTADALRAALQAAAEPHASRTGITADIVIAEDGNPAAIAVTAARVSADLIVMGAHDPARRGSGGFLASMAGRTLETLGRPVLVVERPVDGPYGSAVVGVDFSLISRTALRAARRFAPSALLHLLHAYRVPFKSWLVGADFAEDYAYGERLALGDFLAEELDALKERAIAIGTPETLVRTHLLEGDPVQHLRQLVADTASPLVVIGTHSRTGLARLVLGSVAADLLDHPPADLLVVPVAIPVQP